MAISSPSRRTRSRLTASSAGSNDDVVGEKSPAAAAAATLKTSPPRSSATAAAAPSGEEPTGRNDMVPDRATDGVKHNSSVSASKVEREKHSEPAESRNDGPAKAATTGRSSDHGNNDASADDAETSIDAVSSSADRSVPIQPGGTGAMEAAGQIKAASFSGETPSGGGEAAALHPKSHSEDGPSANRAPWQKKNIISGKPAEKEEASSSAKSSVGANAEKISNATTSNTSFSMTLAIGPSDTQRLYMASKTFNEEIQKLRRKRDSEKRNNDGTDRGGVDGALPATSNDEEEEEGDALEKKRKADSDTHMSDASTSSSNNEGAAAAAAVVQSSPTSPRPTSNGATATTTVTTPTSQTTTTPNTHDQIALLVAAAANSSSLNPLLSSFTSKMRHKSIQEQKTCLLFFLDADKSTKLLMAFDVLSDKKTMDRKEGAAVVMGVNDTLAAMAINEGKGMDEVKVLSRRGLTSLFQSFLTSISTCVHSKSEIGKSSQQGGDKSPNSSVGGDWTGSEKTAKEISAVAIFAANNLIEYVTKEEKENGKYPQQSGDDDASVSFDQFGKWYNSGGFSLVPWLELLDLSKWDYTLKTNKNVAIEQVPLGNGGGTASSTSSSSKRAKFDDSSTPAEAIGSPTGLFESGAAVGATPQPAPPSEVNEGGGVQSFSAMFGEPTQSRAVVSFDFSGTAAGAFHIAITEENLVMLRQLVTRTGFATLTPHHVESVILKHSRCERRKYGDTVYIISRQQFGKFIRDVVPKEASKNFDPNEIENFSNYFTNFFTCFDYNWSDLKKDEVNAKELMVGFSFLCAGNKSSKLAAAYDMLDVDKNGYLTQRGLMQYLRAYLTMLAGISLLSSNKKTTTQIRKQLMSAKRNDAFLAVENGAKWTLGHFFRAFEAQHARSGSTRNNAVAFEDFAKWYTEGGYAVAPWLELLDLKKFLSLIGDFQQPQVPPSGPPQVSPADVLFTFPLAKERSLVVLRDDAHYVRSIVSEMGLLLLTCEEIWSTLSKEVSTRLGAKKSAILLVDQATFVDCMFQILSSKSKNPTQKSSWANFSPEETLKNFFLSFDLTQAKQVPLNQLMCGLTLLCGGKKSNKLVFAFGLFCGEGKNGKKKLQIMDHEDFVQFFRSFLIVMFSCCNQSLSLSADAVSQYISDTAQAVANTVMAYWKGKNVDKVNFDQFSQWYNEGGWQMAPWLELLDLHKWVLADDKPAPAASAGKSATSGSAGSVPVVHAPTIDREILNAFVESPSPTKDEVTNIPPAETPSGHVPSPPPDDDLLLNLVDDDVDMDFILQHESGGAVESGAFEDPTSNGHSLPDAKDSLKFHLLTNEPHGGYVISITPNQVDLLNRLVSKTGLCQTEVPAICGFIMVDAKSRKLVNLTKKSYDNAMQRIFTHAFRHLSGTPSESTKQELSSFSEELFTWFDRSNNKKIRALEFACGFSVLCGGSKSDKLEHIFELLDQDNDSLVSRQELILFLQSFLITLLGVSSSVTLLDGTPCGSDSASIAKAIEAGTEWAISQVFDAIKPKDNKICFDDFADWYTKGGYQSIPWLELLDLRKWVLSLS